ncbi:MAG: alginate regulatory protein AlgP [Labilithrix sp.]|nr:alginate regulatory protein AlgP [Labilithrix sp.]
MSETPKKVSLDAALGAWPEPQKSSMEWEETALSIEARLATAEPGAVGADVSDDSLLIHPLGQIPGEGHNSAASVTTDQTPRKHASKGETMTMQPDRERDRRSLQDLAKLASTGSLTPPPPSVSGPLSYPPSPSVSSIPSSPHSVTGVARAAEASKDDSGIVDLAMAAQSDPQAAVRAQTTPLASGGLFDDEPASVRPGPVSQQLQQPMPSLPPMSAPPVSQAPVSQASVSQAVISSAPSAPSVAPASYAAPSSAPSVDAAGAHPSIQPKKKGGVVVVLALLGAAAIAAGGFVVVKNRTHDAAVAAPKPVETVAKPVDAPKPATTVAAAEATPSAPEMDPNALPSSPDPKAAKPAAGTKVAAAPVGAAAAKPKDEGPAKLTQKDLAPTESGPAGDLGAAMKGAVGDKDKATPAAAENGPQFAAGTVPQKPSQGAVTGAIGAVLPSARACLGPDDAVSRATIVFVSAGTVQSVSVSGGAAGKPAADCIKSALMGAKVAPFAEATYSAPVTVRH